MDTFYWAIFWFDGEKWIEFDGIGLMFFIDGFDDVGEGDFVVRVSWIENSAFEIWELLKK